MSIHNNVTPVDLRGRIEGKAVDLGNTKLMSDVGADISSLQKEAETHRATGASVMFLAVDGKLAGILSVADPIKESTPNALRALQENGIRVIMATGDGINDAPALAAAEVGIAMGTGTDVAMSSAQLTLVKGDLGGILKAIELSNATVANMKQNLVSAFVYNGIGVPIAAGVLYPVFGLLLSPMIVALAMSMSSVSVVVNALRLRQKRLDGL